MALWETCPARQPSYNIAHQRLRCLTGHNHVLQEGGSCVCGKRSSSPQRQGRLHPAPLPRDDAAVCGAASGPPPRLPHHASKLPPWACAICAARTALGLRVWGAADASLPTSVGQKKFGAVLQSCRLVVQHLVKQPVAAESSELQYSVEMTFNFHVNVSQFSRQVLVLISMQCCSDASLTCQPIMRATGGLCEDTYSRSGHVCSAIRLQ